jgi:hypothetical protein
MTAASLAGPDFLAFVVDDLDAASRFWRDVAGLKLAPQSPPGAQVFLTRPVPFAVRVPRPREVPGSGQGVAVWFSVSGDVDEYRAALVRRGAAWGNCATDRSGECLTWWCLAGLSSPSMRVRREILDRSGFGGSCRGCGRRWFCAAWAWEGSGAAVSARGCVGAVFASDADACWEGGTEFYRDWKSLRSGAVSVPTDGESCADPTGCCLF